MRAPARELQRLGCAAALGAIVAFPAGVVFSERESVQSEAPDSKTTTGSALRNTEAGTLNPYAPNILSDPYIVRRQREMVKALEIYCRKTGKDCVEANQARRYLDQREAARTR
jgi:hypothetical protein